MMAFGTVWLLTIPGLLLVGGVMISGWWKKRGAQISQQLVG